MTRWPGRRTQATAEWPEWLTLFDVDAWSSPEDDSDPSEDRYDWRSVANTVARRRWLQSVMAWCRANDVSIIDVLSARRSARRRAAGIDDDAR